MKSGGGRLDFEPPSYFNGQAFISEGMLRAGAGDVLHGSATTVATGAVLDLTAGTTELGSLAGGGSVLLGAGGMSAGTFPGFTGTISGTGGLTVRDSFSVTTPQTYSGATTILGGTSLSGEGSLPGTSRLEIRGAGALAIYSSLQVPARLAAVPVYLNHGSLSLIGNSQSASSQSFGPLTGAGLATISAFADSSLQPATLSFGTLTREDRGTFNFRNGTSGAGLLVGDGRSKITFDSSLATKLVGSGASQTKTPILPFAITGDARTLVTFSPAGGIRSLASGEFSPTLSSGDNVRLTTATTHDGNVTVNALVLNANLSGTGTLSIASGLFFYADSFSQFSTVAKNISFGANEGVIFNQNRSLDITGVLAGSGGITFSGPSEVSLYGANTFTGPLTINQGKLTFFTPSGLGPDSSPIVLNDGTLNAATSMTFTRPIRLTGTHSTVNGGGSGLVLGAPLSGPGGVNIEGYVEYTTPNTYAGDTTVTGTLQFGSDASLGLGKKLLLAGALSLTGPWTSERDLVLTENATISTAGFDAVLRGSLSRKSEGSVLLYKEGQGTLSLSDMRGFTGTIVVEDGTVRFGTDKWSPPNRTSDPVNLLLYDGSAAFQAHPPSPRKSAWEPCAGLARPVSCGCGWRHRGPRRSPCEPVRFPIQRAGFSPSPE